MKFHKLKKFLRAFAAMPYWVAFSLYRRRIAQKGRPPLYLFGFAKWKTWIEDWFPEYDIIFVPSKIWNIEFQLEWRWKLLSDPRTKVLSWQYKTIDILMPFCKYHGIEFHLVEDGFIRSISLGARRVPPISLTFDKDAMYFNSRQPSELENILRRYDFRCDPDLLIRSRHVIDRLLSSRLSKYNSSLAVDVEAIYGPKTHKRILVIGQVERDASIKYGCDAPITNNDLVWLASRENPDSQIIYKPHPEVLQGTAGTSSDPNLVREVALVLDSDISLADSFETIDQVYTITSLAGFEALMRGIPVTTVGCPFYSGWGLTDDRQANPRRDRRLSLEELFAAAYILYPKYIDPNSRRRIEVEEAIDLLSRMKTQNSTAPV